MLGLGLMSAALAYWSVKSDENDTKAEIARNKQSIEIRKFCIDHYQSKMKDEQSKPLSLQAWLKTCQNELNK